MSALGVVRLFYLSYMRCYQKSLRTTTLTKFSISAKLDYLLHWEQITYCPQLTLSLTPNALPIDNPRARPTLKTSSRPISIFTLIPESIRPVSSVKVF